MTIEEIERAVEALPPEELARFRAWFVDYDFAAWDRQIADDSSVGTLKELAEQAKREHESGGTSPL